MLNIERVHIFLRRYCVKVLVYYNSGENEKAIRKFKNVANNYPGSPEGIQAVSTARLIYIDLGRVDEYASWVKSFRLC